MGKVEIELASLDQQTDQLVCLVVVTLQIEGTQLWDEKLKVLAHGCLQIWVDAASCKAVNGIWLVGVQLDQERNRIRINHTRSSTSELPFGKSSDEVWLCG
jgi:hypothetical protein